MKKNKQDEQRKNLLVMAVILYVLVYTWNSLHDEVFEATQVQVNGISKSYSRQSKVWRWEGK